MIGDKTFNKNDSQISSALHVEMDQTTIEVDENQKSIFIGKFNWRKFLLGATSALMFVTLFLIASVIVFFIDRNIFRDIFLGFDDPWNGFDIFAYVSFVIVILIPTIQPNAGRKATIPLMLVIIGCYAYIPAFLVRLTISESINTSETVLIYYMSWFSCVVGLFINVISTKRKFNPTTGVIITIVLDTLFLILYVLIFKKTDPYKFELILAIGLCTCVAYYLNIDAMFMLNKRNDFYLKTDWFLGFVHFHTDIFFRFWMDIFQQDVNYIDNSTLNDKSIVLNSALPKSKLTPISKVNEEHEDIEDVDRTNVMGNTNNKQDN